jgi:WD40 repeat protein
MLQKGILLKKLVLIILAVTLLTSCSSTTTPRVTEETHSPSILLTPTLTIAPTLISTPTPTLEPVYTNPFAGFVPKGAIARFGKGSVRNIHYSPDGKQILISTSDHIFTYSSKDLSLQTISENGDESSFSHTYFSDDGKFSAIISNNNQVNMKNLDTGEIQTVLLKYAYYTFSLGPNGKILAAFNNLDGSIDLVDTTNGNVLFTLTGFSGHICHMTFLLDGHTFITSSNDGKVIFWDYTTGEQIKSYSVYSGEELMGMVFSPDGSILATSYYEYNSIYLWDTASGNKLVELNGHTGWVNVFAFSPDGSKLASTSIDKTVRLWDISTGELLNTFTDFHGDSQLAVFSPDGINLISSSYDGTVVLRDLTLGSIINTLDGFIGQFETVAISDDSKMVAGGTWGSEVYVFDLPTNELKQKLSGHTDVVTALAFSHDGKFLASASGTPGYAYNNPMVILWDIESGQKLQTLTGFSHRGIKLVTFSPDGLLLAIADEDDLTSVWNVADGSLMTSRKEQQGIESLDFSPEGKTLISYTVNDGKRIWDFNNGNVTRIQGIVTVPALVPPLAISNDVTILAFRQWNNQNNIIIWDVVNNIELKTIETGIDNRNHCLAFSPDNKVLISSYRRAEDYSDTVALWDVKSGNELETFAGYSCGMFSPDGEKLFLYSDTILVLENKYK